MKEKFLQYIWQHGLFDKENLVTSTGDNVEIVKTGELNNNAGPDFFNARVRINDTLWAGNIEIHKKASDWYKHHHNKDAAYNNVILHVVQQADADATCMSGQAIPTVSLQYNTDLEQKYELLLNANETIRCKNDLPNIDSFKLRIWLEKLTIERLEQKTSRILDLLEQTGNNWEECFYVSVARSFGFNINDIPFELLAKSLPLRILAKHKDNLPRIEALLYGQAGMLSGIKQHDEYSLQLQTEYLFLQNKYSLIPINGDLWKRLRLRPSNFPTIRIAQFADLIYRSTGLFSKIIETPTIESISKLFDCSVSEYWQSHYSITKPSKKKNKHLGETGRQLIIVNTIIPFIFAYGINRDDSALKQIALDLLEQLPAENNAKIREWEEAGIHPENALTSQALLQLTNNYCISGKCLHCQIGNQLLRHRIEDNF